MYRNVQWGRGGESSQPAAFGRSENVFYIKKQKHLGSFFVTLLLPGSHPFIYGDYYRIRIRIIFMANKDDSEILAVNEWAGPRKGGRDYSLRGCALAIL